MLRLLNTHNILSLLPLPPLTGKGTPTTTSAAAADAKQVAPSARAGGGVNAGVGAQFKSPPPASNGSNSNANNRNNNVANANPAAAAPKAPHCVVTLLLLRRLKAVNNLNTKHHQYSSSHQDIMHRLLTITIITIVVIMIPKMKTIMIIICPSALTVC